MLYYIHQTLLSSWRVDGGSGFETLLLADPRPLSPPPLGPGNEARLIHSLYISLCLVRIRVLLVYLARPCMIEIYDTEC